MQRMTFPALPQFALVCLLAPMAGAALIRTEGRSAVGRELRGAKRATATMSALYPFYHTTQNIRDELRDLASSCPGMTLESMPGPGDDGEDRTIDVVTLRAPGTVPVNKNFFLFGEHSRELISPESGLHFVKTLCGQTSLSTRAGDVLRDNEFQIVVNGNPGSREKVENGDFCLRVNPDGVDLNRNWDEKWQPDAEGPSQTNPGPKPFSEHETQVFKQLVEAYQPTTFLTVHSGTKGMYMPWAYDMEHLANRNQPEMMEILKALDTKHCECPFGAAGREVGYSCPGTCLDWVYDHVKSNFSFAFEIYTSPDYDAMLRARWQEKIQSGGVFYQEHSHLGHAHFHDLFVEHPSCFVQTREGRDRQWATHGMSPPECFGMFNPQDEGEYTSVIENWSNAYFDMATMIVAKMKRPVGNNITI